MSTRKTDAPYLRLIRTVEGFRGATDMDLERLSSDFPVGQEYEAVLKAPRSAKRMGLYWAILHFVHSNDPYGYASPEKIHRALLIDAGYCSPERNLDGSIVMMADSVSFAKMPEATFRRYFDHALKLIWTHWEIDIDTLLREGKRLNSRTRNIKSYPSGVSNGTGKAAPRRDRGPEDDEGSEDPIAAQP